MKSDLSKKAKLKTLDFSGFSKLNVNELMKIRGGGTTTGGDGGVTKVPD